ncbi:hypothetical protein IFM89_011178 [Coptis chinensis]|uniref:Uncharacterized protein n=1 Tax=Coptis chinensis TaxID=261450 RepID=A0A835HUB0_9MAGN|nr:hypothetical protein IFM89_011178 [Coptis chinensis]
MDCSFVPKAHSSHFHELNNDEAVDLGGILKLMLLKLSRQLNDPPYNFMIHSSPFKVDASQLPYAHWFLQIVPQLSGVGGFEIGSGCYINPVFPGDVAKELKGNIHFFCRVRPMLPDDGASAEASVICYPTSMESLGQGIDLLQNGNLGIDKSGLIAVQLHWKASHLVVFLFVVPENQGDTTPLAGSSAGAIVCVVIASGSSMKEALEATKVLAEDCQLRGTAFHLGAVLRELLVKFLPDDVHTRSNGRVRGRELKYPSIVLDLLFVFILLVKCCWLSIVAKTLSRPLADAEGAKKYNMIELLKTYGGLSYPSCCPGLQAASSPCRLARISKSRFVAKKIPKLLPMHYRTLA